MEQSLEGVCLFKMVETPVPESYIVENKKKMKESSEL